MSDLQSTGDRLADIQKINDLAMTLYKMHLAASMDDAAKMAEETLFGASKREALSAQHIDETPIGDMMPEIMQHQQEAAAREIEHTPTTSGIQPLTIPHHTPPPIQEIDASALDEDIVEIPSGDEAIIIGGSPIIEEEIKPEEPHHEVQTTLLGPHG